MVAGDGVSVLVYAGYEGYFGFERPYINSGSLRNI